jgi:hypothetical protein
MAAGDPPVDLMIAGYRLGDGATGLDAIYALCAHIGRSVLAIIVTRRYLAVAHQGSHRQRSSSSAQADHRQAIARSDRCSLR